MLCHNSQVLRQWFPMQYHSALRISRIKVPSVQRLGKNVGFGYTYIIKTSSPVIDARKLHLLSILGAEKPSMSFSTINPWIFPSGFFAQTMATSAKGEFENPSFRSIKNNIVSVFHKLSLHHMGFEPWFGSK